MIFDLHKGHYHPKMASALLLTNFGSHRALVQGTVQDFCSYPPYMPLTKYGKNPITCMERVANCQKERKKPYESNKLRDTA